MVPKKTQGQGCLRSHSKHHRDLNAGVGGGHAWPCDGFVFASLRYARLAGTKRRPVIDALIV